GYHILNILDLGCIDAAAIMRRRFKVVVDTVNGAAFFALPALLEALGCAVVRLHCNPDGTFPRGTEPVPANLTDLGAAVVLHGADLGMATDPDADRLALVDEDGQPLGEDLTQVLAIDGFLRRTGNQQPVVTNLSSSLLLDRICERHGVEVKRSAVGEINVVNVMRAAGSLIGGEGNGGVILAESHLGRDSLVGAALVLDRLAQQTMTIGAVRDSYPKFEIVKDKVSIAGLNPEGVTGHIAAAYTNVQQDTVDGLKLLWGDRWVHVRKSNTEAVIRIIAEAPDAAAARQLADDVKQLVMEMPVKGPQ
ncbi:MAG: phosphoglucosamine mutase, partial [Candidatus Marinimicrobia bacterium]|nr:phosphoglucosamine mutase [Candidatus Neomarinimicrobiota bacterium]